MQPCQRQYIASSVLPQEARAVYQTTIARVALKNYCSYMLCRCIHDVKTRLRLTSTEMKTVEATITEVTDWLRTQDSSLEYEVEGAKE